MSLHQNQSAQETWRQIDALAAPRRRKFRTVGARWLTIVAVTLAAAVLTHVVVTGIWDGDNVSQTGHGSAIDALAVLGAIAGFWFAYTGRLARLFRKV